MAGPQANQPHFVLAVDGFERNPFQALEFRGVDTVSLPCRFDILAAAGQHDIDPGDVVGRRASLFIYRDGLFYPYSGIVTRLRFVARSSDYSTYELRVRSAFWTLALNRRSRVFQNVGIPDIVGRILDETGLADTCRFELRRSYPAQEYVVQYKESDLNFVSRLLESRGIWYFFREPPLAAGDMDGCPVTETIVFADSADSFEAIAGESEILYRTRSGMNEKIGRQTREWISDLAYGRRMLPKEVVVKNYNYRRPESPLTARVTLEDGDRGSVYEFGGDFRDSDGAQEAAEVIRRRLASAQFTVEGAGCCRGLRAGYRFTVTGHARDDLNTTYVVTSVVHHGSHGGLSAADAQLGYRNRFRAIPGSRADLFAPPRRARIPRLSGVLTAPIESRGAPYASLDDMGRYKVRMPFDISDSGNTEASKYIRLAQPYSGANYGMHFPSHEGTEMVVACIDGDPNRPLGLGTAPNANTLPPVTSINKEQNILRTAGSNELLMDDTDGKQKVQLTTAAGNALVLDDGEQTAALQTTDENALVLDDAKKEATLTVGDHVISLSYKSGSEAIVISTADGHVVRIDDANRSLTIQSAGGHTVAMDDDGKTLILTDSRGTSTVTLKAGKGVTIESDGEITISAAKDLTLRGANVNIGSSQGTIEAKARQELKLSGMEAGVTATAGDLTMEGLNVEVAGTMKTAVKGSLGVEIQSDLQTKVSGLLTELSASALTTVKGGLVMIN